MESNIPINRADFFHPIDEVAGVSLLHALLVIWPVRLDFAINIFRILAAAAAFSWHKYDIIIP